MTAPVSGVYRFWILGDDSARLSLGANNSIGNLEPVLQTSTWRKPDEWDWADSTDYINLSAGSSTLLELMGYNASGPGHAHVRWSYAGNSFTNWALQSGAVATQSGTSAGGVASRAIDGNRSPLWEDNSISHTYSSTDAWWQVDLGQDRTVDQVIIWNRLDNLAHLRLSNFKISLLASDGTVVAEQLYYDGVDESAGSHVIWEPANAPVGRIVKIQLQGNGAAANPMLNLAEVEVNGRADLTEAFVGVSSIDLTHLSAAGIHDSDMDQDGLLDSWEAQYGFSTTALETGDRLGSSDADRDGMINYEESRNGTDPLTGDSISGVWTMEFWDSIVGYDVEDFRRTRRSFENPDRRVLKGTNSLTELDVYQAVRMRGRITAPVSGNYTFWVSSSDGTELWLSEDSNKYNKKLIAAMGPRFGTGHGIEDYSSNLWDQHSSQISQEVYLEAGQSYFTELVSQQGHGANKHISIAWAKPGSAREPLDLTALSSFEFDAADLDDDYLPDSWESNYGLDTNDNGLLDPARQGERGDYDFDGLSNHREYLLGTDPSEPDSDGDGVNDGDEVHGYHSDPNVADSPAEQLVHTFDLGSFSTSTESWISANGQLVSSSFRNDIEWQFTTSTAGYSTIKLALELKGDPFDNEAVPIRALIDGRVCYIGDIVFGSNHQAVLRLITGNLAAGSHTLRLEVLNSVARRTVAISSMGLYTPQGPDLDNDGTADWVTERLLQLNSVINFALESTTSPLFIEGLARSVGDVLVDGNSVTPLDSKGRWFTNLDLDSAQSTNFDIEHEPGFIEQRSTLWTAADVFASPDLLIRSGDTIKFSAPSNSSYPISLVRSGINWTQVQGVTATQSSTAWGGEAEFAIDGNVSGNYNDNTVTHTNNNGNNWLQIDLGAERELTSIEIYNRNTQQTRLSNYRVSLHNASGTEVWGQDFHTSGTTHSGDVELITLPSTILAQQVKIARLGPDAQGLRFLSIAEVIAYGSEQHTLASATDEVQLEAIGASLQPVLATAADGSVASFNLNVKKANLTKVEHDLLSNTIGTIKLPTGSLSDDTIFLNLSDGGRVISYTPKLAGSADMKVETDSSGSVSLVARLFPDGPILDYRPVNLIKLTDAFEAGVTFQSFTASYNGYSVITSPLVVDNLPAGASVRITIFRSGVTFPDGSTVLWLSAEDFENGIYNMEFVYPDGIAGGFCHYIDVYDRNGSWIGTR